MLNSLVFISWLITIRKMTSQQTNSTTNESTKRLISYPDYSSDNFTDILNKHEFAVHSSQNNKSFLYQDPNQMLMRNYISQPTPYESMLLFHGLGSGKCHKRDTPILMYDGTIKMVQDIKEGDFLMGDDSTPRKVMSLARGEDNMYDIIPVKGDAYTVNEEHILCLKASGYPNLFDYPHKKVISYIVQWVEQNKFCSKNFRYQDNNKKEKYQEAKNFLHSIQNEQVIEISVKDYLQLSNTRKSILKGYKTPVEFSNKQVDIDPYMLGYWLGDGTSRGIEITTNDVEIVTYFETNLKKYNLQLNKRQSKYTYGITGSGKTDGNLFLTTLKQLNLLNNKHIPHIYKCNSREQRLTLLAGILDADGSYDIQKRIYEFSQCLEHEQLMDDVIYLCRSLGFACYKSKKKTSWTYLGVKKYGEAWRICISGKGIETIPTLCPRKQAEPRRQIKDVLVTGIQVKPVGRDHYYGFTLDGNCRYVMGDFTVTHNTCTSITVAEGFKEYVNNLGRRIVVLVKNKNIQRNFINELLSSCTQNEYVTPEQRQLYFGINIPKTPGVMAQRKELINKIHRLINKSYLFITYGTFVNQVLGAKVFEKDELNRNTNKVKKINGEVQRKRAKNVIKDLSNTVVIVDEAHNITNNDVYIALKSVLSRSFNYRLLLLTATPMYDNPKEIFELSNLLNIKREESQFPIRNELLKPTFNNYTLLTKIQSPLISNKVLKGGIIHVSDDGIAALQKAFHGKVSYLQPNNKTNPDKVEMGDYLIPNRIGTSKVVYCKMSKHQYVTYLNALKLDVKSDSKYDISSAIQNLEAGENTQESVVVSKTGSLYKNSSDASTMSYPDHLFGKEGFTTLFSKNERTGWKLRNEELAKVVTEDLPKYSAKLAALIDNIGNSPGNVFVYTNYVSFGGTSLIKQVLLRNGYVEYRSNRDQRSDKPAFILFDESTNIETREKYRRIFNSPANKDGDIIKIILGSPIISEGITLKNVRQVHIIEPSWNMSRINQIIGRAVRNYSHHDLPPEQRNVEIYKYVSVFVNKKLQESKSSLAKFFIDREKYILAEEKDRANKKVERMLKETSFDCHFMRQRNTLNVFTDGSPECDYQNCNFSCANPAPPPVVDKSTYNLHINFFDKHDIAFITNTLRDLFKKHFVWSLNDILQMIHTIEPHISKEAVYSTLGHITQSKSPFTDMYNRDGFILNKGEYYIFNGSDIDIDSSLYSKILDFSIDTTKYNLNEYVKEKLDIDLSDDTNAQKRTKKSPKAVKLSDTDIKYNSKIISNNLIFGTYRERGTRENPYGPIDNKFRIVDMRNPKSKKKVESDKRKNITGMWIGSYKKPQLIEIARFLKIKTKLALEEYDKDELGKIIEKTLVQNGKVLK